MVSAMTRQQTYPLPSRTRAVYPPLPIGARQAFLIPNIIKGFTHRDFFWYTYGSGTFNHVVDLQTEYVYIYIYVSAGGASVVLENSVFGRIDISLSPYSEYRNVLRSGGQPIRVTITKPSGYFGIYIAEGIYVDGEVEIIRERPRSWSEPVTILGDDVVAGYRQVVYLEIPVIYGEAEMCVNDDCSYGGIYRKIDLDREIVITARGNGFVAIWTHLIYASYIMLNVDTAYIDPYYLSVYENNRRYNIPCIYRNPVLGGFYPFYDVTPYALVLEITDQLKEYKEYIDRYRTEVCGIGSRYPVE